MKRIAASLLSVLLALTVIVPGLIAFADQEALSEDTAESLEEESGSSIPEDSHLPDDSSVPVPVETPSASEPQQEEGEEGQEADSQSEAQAFVPNGESGQTFPRKPSSANGAGGAFSHRYENQLTSQGREVYSALSSAVSGGQTEEITCRFSQPLTLELNASLEQETTDNWSRLMDAMTAGSVERYEQVTNLPVEALLLDQAALYWIEADDIQIGPYGYQSDEQSIALTGVVFRIRSAGGSALGGAVDGFPIEGGTTYEKLKSIHDGLIRKGAYSVGAPKASLPLLSPYEASGEGYARAFQLLCEKAGITSVLVSGGNHMWNAVRLEDGNWYGVDAALDNTVPASHRYFLGGQDVFGAEHRPQGLLAAPELAMSSYRPNAAAISSSNAAVTANGQWVYGSTLSQSGVTIAAANPSVGQAEWVEGQLATAGTGSQSARYRFTPHNGGDAWEGSVEVVCAPRVVTVSSVQLSEKTADGRLDGQAREIALEGLLPADEGLVQVDVEATSVTFGDAQAGTGKEYTVRFGGLTGAKALHYRMDQDAAAFYDGVILPAGPMAAPATTTALSLDKEYDGLPAGAPGGDGVSLVYEGTRRDGQSYGPIAEPPTDAGSYTLARIRSHDGTVIDQTNFSISPKTVQVAPQEISVPAGGNPIYLFAYSGFVDGQGEETLLTEPVASCAVIDQVGTYPIQLTQLPTAVNYIFEDAGTQAYLTVQARAADASYYSVNPGSAGDWYSDTIVLAPVGKDGFDTMVVAGDGEYTRSDPLVIAVTGNGQVEMRFARSEDGLLTDSVLFQYKMDDAPPSISDIAYTQQPDGSGGVLSVKAEDPLSGVKEIRVITPQNLVLSSAAPNDGTAEFALSKSGTYTIEAEDNAGNRTSIAYALQNHTIESIDVFPAGGSAQTNTVEMQLNTALPLTARANSATGAQEGTDFRFTWLSSNESIARVDAQGNVTMLRMGAATIYASALGCYGSVEVVARVENALNDTASGQFTIQMSDSALPSEYASTDDLTVVVKALTFGEQLRLWQENGMDSRLLGYQSAQTMDIHLIDGQQDTVQPADAITIFVPYPSGTGQAYEFVVYHERSRGQVEQLSYTRTSTGLQFATRSLSPFVIAYKAGGTVVVPPATTPSIPGDDRDSSRRSSNDWRRSRQDDDDFWGTVGLQVTRASAGDRIRVNLSTNNDGVPVSLLLRLKGRDVTLRFSWPDGRAVDISGKDIGSLPDFGTYSYKKLLEMSAKTTTIATPGPVPADVVEEVGDDEEPPVVATMVITAPESGGGQSGGAASAPSDPLPEDVPDKDDDTSDQRDDDTPSEESSISQREHSEGDLDMGVPMVVTTPRRDPTASQSSQAAESGGLFSGAAMDLVLGAVTCCIAIVVGLFLYLYKKFSY